MSSEKFNINDFYNQRKDFVKKDVDEELGIQVKENIFDPKDFAASGVTGVAKGVTYLFDLPSMINEAGEFLVEKAMSPVNNFIKRRIMGKSEEEIADEEEDEDDEDLEEGVMDTLRKIVKDKQMQKVKFANGKTMRIDLTTASAMVNAHDKRIKNDATKAKFADAVGICGAILRLGSLW